MRKKIVFTLPNFNTAGSGKALLNLALGLDKEIFEAHIVTQSEKGEFFKTVKNSGLGVHVFNYIPKSRPIQKMLSEAWEVSRRFKEIGADLIHSFHYSDNYTEGLAARFAGIPWVFTKKNMSWGGASGNGWKLRSALAKGIAVQNTDMIRQFYPNSNKTALIPRGVDVVKFSPQPPKDVLRQGMKTEAGERIIICVANMVPVKGIELLIEAFKNLHRQFANWDVWLIGGISNDYGKRLIDLVEQNQLSDRIHFSGRKPNVREYLDCSEIFVLPTKDEGRREGSPVAMLEAMANGKLVVGSGVPGVRDQLKDFPNFLFEAGNAKDLEVKLTGLLSNSKEQNLKLGRRFLEMANQKFRIDQEVQKHEMFYKKVLDII